MRKLRCPRCGLVEAVLIKQGVLEKGYEQALFCCSACEHHFFLAQGLIWEKRSHEIGEKKAIKEYRMANGLPLGEFKDNAKFMGIFIKLLGVGFVIAAIGAIGKFPLVTAFGALLMAPLFIAIAFSLAGMVAENAESAAAKFAGNAVGKVVYWSVFLIMAILFLWGGTGSGPHFWGSID